MLFWRPMTDLLPRKQTDQQKSSLPYLGIISTCIYLRLLMSRLINFLFSCNILDKFELDASDFDIV